MMVVGGGVMVVGMVGCGGNEAVQVISRELEEN